MSRKESAAVHFTLPAAQVRPSEFNRRAKRVAKLPASRITNSSSEDPLSTAADCPSTATRTGADDFLAIPSRYGDQLRYRDGRVVDAPATNPST